MLSLYESEALVAMRMEQNRRLAVSTRSLRRRLRPVAPAPRTARPQ